MENIVIDKFKRSAMGFARKSVNIQSYEDNPDFPNCPIVIEGAELFDSVCPVSKLTGRRTNPLSLLGMITGAKADVLNAILMELPSIKSDSRLTDEDRVNFIVQRCSSGTPAEDAIMAEKLMADIDALGLSQDPKVDSSSSSISFNSSDGPDPKSE